jgi:flagellar protein FlaJ
MSVINRKKKIKDREKVGPIHIYAYKTLNERCKFLHPKFKPLEKAIKESMMPIPFEVYLASMVFFSMISAIGGAIVGIGVALMINVQPAILEYLMTTIAALHAGNAACTTKP